MLLCHLPYCWEPSFISPVFDWISLIFKARELRIGFYLGLNLNLRRKRNWGIYRHDFVEFGVRFIGWWLLSLSIFSRLFVIW